MLQTWQKDRDDLQRQIDRLDATHQSHVVVTPAKTLGLDEETRGHIRQLALMAGDVRGLCEVLARAAESHISDDLLPQDRFLARQEREKTRA